MTKSIKESKIISGKKKNGHKMDCSCHICENMKNKAMRGGYDEEEAIKQEKLMGGSKKKNGHRRYCKCIICNNMQRSKKNRSKTSKKSRKVGGDQMEEEASTNEYENMNIGGTRKRRRIRKR